MLKYLFSLIKSNRQLALQMTFVFAAFFVMVLIGSIYGRSIIDKNVESYGKEVVNTAGETINAYLEAYNIMLGDLSFSLTNLKEHDAGITAIQEELEVWTERLIKSDKKYEEFTGFYGVVDGVFVDGSGWNPTNPDKEEYDPDYVPEERPWYKVIKGFGGEVYFTDPYLDADTGEYVLTASRALVYGDGIFFGTLSMDLFFEDIVKIVNDLTLMENGYGILLDSQRNIVVTSRLDTVGIFFDGIDEGHAEIGRDLDANEGVVQHSIFSYGEEFVTFFKQIPCGWYIGVAAPESSYYRDRTQMTLVLSLAGLLLSVPLCAVLAVLHIRKARADEANNLKTSFLARMSHEMRTPMNAIIGMSQLIKNEPLSRQQSGYLEELDTSAKSLLVLIDNILEIPDLKDGQAEGETELYGQNESPGSRAVFTAPGAKALLVDDNEVNLKVASGLLSKLYGMDVKTAQSGKEAISLVQGNDFDVVFMDHMMPEMDGIETVREIRKLGGKHKSLKIIALTANAIAGVREMFMANGFAGFLTKPIKTDELSDMLQSVLPEEKIISSNEQLAMSNKAMQGIAPELGVRSEEPGVVNRNGFLYNLEKIDEINIQIALSRVSGIEEMLEETLELFYNKLPDERGRLTETVESDLKTFAVSVHGLKSALAAIGAMQLSDKAFELEKASKQQDGEFCRRELPEFVQRLEALHKKLDRVFEIKPGAGSEEIRVPGSGIGGRDEKLLQDKLQQVIDACEDFDDTAALEALKELKKHDFGGEINKQLTEAVSAVKDFDYDKAAEIISSITAK